MATRIEYELKYRVHDRAAAERLLTGPDLVGLAALGPVRTVHMEDRYVDTSAGGLARAGYAARIRHEPGATLVSVKALHRGSHPQAALHRREELEGPADRATPPIEWPPSAARSLVLELAGDAPLVEIVTIRQLRRRRAFGGAAGELEASLDEVEVVSRGDVVTRFTDLEVELRAGDPDLLARVAAALAGEAGLEAAATSKYETALLAVGQPVWAIGGSGASHVGVPSTPPTDDPADPAPAAPAPADPAAVTHIPAPAAQDPAAPAPAAPAPTTHTRDSAPPERPIPDHHFEVLAMIGKSPGVSGADTVAEAGRKVLRFHFARLLAAEGGTRSGDDPEDLHKMRVATRRLRAAWRIFGHAYLPHETRRFPRELRALGRRLGAVRDLDVLIGGLETHALTLPIDEAEALGPLLDAWRRRRDAARSDLIAELDSEDYRRFVAAFETFVTTEGAAVRPIRATEPHHVRDTAPSRIWEAHERVRAYEHVLPWADVATLHELRIAAKWLRYAIEFVRDALSPDARPLIEAVVSLQDHLGLLHDADVASELTRRFLLDDGTRLGKAERDAIGHYLVSRQREVARLRRSATRPWRSVAGRSFRTRLARCLAGL